MAEEVGLDMNGWGDVDIDCQELDGVQDGQLAADTTEKKRLETIGKKMQSQTPAKRKCDEVDNNKQVDR